MGAGIISGCFLRMLFFGIAVFTTLSIVLENVNNYSVRLTINKTSPLMSITSAFMLPLKAEYATSIIAQIELFKPNQKI